MFINLNKFKTSSVYKAISSLFLDFTATNTLDDRVTFSRTSNATVTNSAGLIAYAPHNLLTFSEQFDNAAWAKTGSTATANSTTAPDGTTTADTLVEDTSNNAHSYNQSVTTIASVDYCFSVFLKNVDRQYVSISFNRNSVSTVWASAVFDLVGGTVTGTNTSGGATLVSSSITNVGSGWYRCQIVANIGANTDGQVYLAGASASSGASFRGAQTYVGTSKSFYLWGAQLEQRSTATTYNPTTVKNLLGFTEAFDNAAWTKSSSFVQTNLLTYSQDFDNAAWGKTNTTVTTNNAVSPDGTLTSDLVIANSTSGSHLVSQNFTPVSGTAYTLSGYFKAAGYNFCALQITFGGLNAFCSYNLSTGALTGVSGGGGVGTITAVGNGWYRCTLTATTTNTTLNPYNIRVEDDGDLGNWSGNGFSGIAVWGAQLVQGAVAGDYRRTDAAALPVFYPNHNGVVCAQKLVGLVVPPLSPIGVSQTITTTVAPYTFSIYAKAGEKNWFRYGLFSSNHTVWFDVLNGVIGTQQSGVTSASIIAVGNGWYRCSVTVTMAAGSYALPLRTADSNGSTGDVGDGTSGIYIFGAQLSDSASLDPYVLNAAAAPTAAAYYGPRFDYDPVTLQPKGLLIEEQRTNLLQSTTAFNNAVYGWYNNSGFYSTVTLNDTTGVDGALSAAKLAATATSGNFLRNQSSGQSNNTVDTLSVYMKKGNINFGVLRNLAITGSPYAWFNLNNGTVGTVQAGLTATITNAGNGWYRCSITGTTLASIVNNFIDIVPAATDNSQTVAIGDYIYIDRPQLENGAFPTSHIPTVASQVTRTADNATIQGSNFYSWYNQNEGSVYCQVSDIKNPSASIFALDDGTTNQRILNIFNGQTIQMAFRVVNGGTDQANFSPSNFAALSTVNYASAYKINDFAAVTNGGAVATDTVGTVPLVTIARVGNNVVSGAQINGTIKKLSYYNTRLSNSTLQSITS